MALVLDILKWSGIVAATLATAGVLVVAAMVWLLGRPIDDDRRKSARRS